MDNGKSGMAGRPWGASRLGPYPTTVEVPFTAVGIDPDTQLGVFRDASGRIVNMVQQAMDDSTSRSTNRSTSRSTNNVTFTGGVSSFGDTDHYGDNEHDSESDNERD